MSRKLVGGLVAVFAAVNLGALLWVSRAGGPPPAAQGPAPEAASPSPGADPAVPSPAAPVVASPVEAAPSALAPPSAPSTAEVSAAAAARLATGLGSKPTGAAPGALAERTPLAASTPEDRRHDARMLAEVGRALRGPVPPEVSALLERAQAGAPEAELRAAAEAWPALQVRVILLDWLDARSGRAQSPQPPAEQAPRAVRPSLTPAR